MYIMCFFFSGKAPYSACCILSDYQPFTSSRCHSPQVKVSSLCPIQNFPAKIPLL
uniref:Uncharacterized protein n=1 Tax=Anguilla anguilla TaxID=7936 RepID=A0A0E9U9G7_ANGAN